MYYTSGENYIKLKSKYKIMKSSRQKMCIIHMKLINK